MNGFIRQRALARARCHVLGDPACASTRTPDVMGYHTSAEIPNYWTYAKGFVLDDHMFEPVKSWSLADHLYMIWAWGQLRQGQAQLAGFITPREMGGRR